MGVGGVGYATLQLRLRGGYGYTHLGVGDYTVCVSCYGKKFDKAPRKAWKDGFGKCKVMRK